MRRKKRLKQVKLKGPLLYVRNLDRIGISNIETKSREEKGAEERRWRVWGRGVQINDERIKRSER